MGNTIIIGVTGPTGAGKSTLRLAFQERGCCVIDTDSIAREIVEPGQPALDELAKEFGGDIIRSDGTLDRALLARRAFISKEKASRLNAITHPKIAENLARKVIAARKQGLHAVIEAPLLFEARLDTRCDAVIAVMASRQVRINRIKFRDGLSAHAAHMRVNAQQDDEFYTSRTNYVIYNDGDTESFIKEGEKLIDKILREYAE
ncbi:MAG: dephospho-CoA kinase [Clostridia bacterium]|nr:dephospho-CoA kinase [Oscillospiraceae bacterium]MBQ6797501.1 dephospho-CoA kinase [Clostridia bacterium]